MKDSRIWIAVCVLLVVVGCSGGASEESQAEPAAVEPAAAEAAPPELTVEEQIAAMNEGCAAAADAIAARQAESSLYERLGGRDKIHAVVVDVVARNHANPAISRVMEGVDDAHLIEQVTDYISHETGGDVAYNGRDLATAHAHLHLSNEDFLIAGADVREALVAAGIGENEIQELMCFFAARRDQVVTAPAS